jgi:hypothetical protein
VDAKAVKRIPLSIGRFCKSGSPDDSRADRRLSIFLSIAMNVR